MDEVFKAINDPSRRLLLDELYEQDGQTLGELCAHLPDMTRYGVMNHLRVLEEAKLVTTLKRGREKFHYLNPVPIRVIHDRWISRFSELRVGAIADIKARVEEANPESETAMDKPAHIYTTYIRGSAAQVWDAITNPDKTVQYFYGTAVDSTWGPGAEMNYHFPDGRAAATGHVIAVDAPHRLEFTFLAQWSEELTAEGAAREVWRLQEMGEMVELTVELYDIGEKTLDDFRNGLPYILSGLKSLVETGTALPAPA